jgi:DNA-binding FadR family transcriptional regulator
MQQLVEALRGEALRCPEGELIGSEEELLARLRVSRPTLRRAASVVAQEQLLQVRRGAKGGYIARRPTSRAVAHIVALYLRTRDANREQHYQSMTPIRMALARLAASNLDEASRQALQDFLQRDAQAIAEGAGFRAFVESEREFRKLLGAASGNEVLSLFLDILYDLRANVRERVIYPDRPERVKAYRELRARLIEAILGGDPNMAALLSDRVSELYWQWVEEASGRPPSKNPSQLQYDGPDPVA